MSVHVHVVRRWVRKSKFLELVQLQLPASADNIYSQLYQCLKETGGLTNDHLASKLVMFSADGASNLQGAQKGVQSRLREHAPKMLVMHCMAHRVQLAAKSTEKCYLLSELLALLHMIAKLYGKSPLRVQ
jgi:hypothetical protein